MRRSTWVAYRWISFGDYRGIDGIIGLDILRDYDLDIDAPKHVLTLYRIRQCERADPPWDEPAIPIAGTSTMTGWMDIPFEINGSAQTAMVDTGSSYTEITPRLLRRIGLSAQDLANDRTLNLHVVAGDDVQVQRSSVSDDTHRSDRHERHDRRRSRQGSTRAGWRTPIPRGDDRAGLPRHAGASGSHSRRIVCTSHARTMTQRRCSERPRRPRPLATDRSRR